MEEPTVSPFGTWASPVTAALVAGHTIALSEPIARPDAVYWLELRPSEGGRYVVVRGDPFTAPVDVTPAGYNVRDKVHEYGGGAYTVHGGTVYFANFDDQRLYRQEIAGEPRAITPDPEVRGSIRYADLDVDPSGRILVCVRERHEEAGIVNELVVLPTDGSSEPRIVAGGHDFYGFPRFSPDGGRLAWISWDMPNMPWDGTELWVADVGEDGRQGEPRFVAGGPSESIFQPQWGPDGVLHFVSDRTGWWNLYRAEEDGPRNLTPAEAEFAVPMWELGYSTYTFLSDGRIACLYRDGGVHHLAVLDPATAELIDLDLPYTCYEPPYLRSSGMQLVFVGGGPSIPHQVVALDFVTRGVEVLRVSEDLTIDEALISVPEPIEFPTEGDRTAFGYYYAPKNPDFVAPAGELPPLVVQVHGGPTAESTPELSLWTQFFTSRGLAVVDVNYGGSTGYGREYRERLNGQWGVVDVVDAISAARYLVGRGLADPDRLAISGGSAGGWTTLCAVTFHDVFAVGASYFGVSDLEPFATFTHKFELRYTDGLVGPWPEAADLWRSRSPVRSADRMTTPLLLLQGLEDEIVPPEQSEIVVRALDANGVPHAYLAFEGEQHGFRKAETIVRALEAELGFYGRILGFTPADQLEPIEVRHPPA